MRVLIVGGGKVGSYLVDELTEDGHTVTIVDKNPEVCENLKSEHKGLTVVCGDGNDPAVLAEAGIRKADALAAVTGEDEDNLVIGLIGRREFNVKRIVGRINNPKNEWLFTKAMGIDVSVNPAMIIARLIEEELSVGELAILLKLRRGNLSLVELRLEPVSPSLGKRLSEIQIPFESVIVAISRGESVVVPSEDIILQADDEVLILTRPEKEAILANVILGKPLG